MYKKLLFFILLIFSAITNLNMHAIFYKIEVLEKDGKKVYLLGDVHRDFDDEKRTNQQRNDAVKIAKQLNAFCFFEDKWHYEGKNASIISGIKFDIRLRNDILRKLTPTGTVGNKQRSPCMGICYKCTKKNILFKNIEFRHYLEFTSAEEGKTIKNVLITALAKKYESSSELAPIWKDNQFSLSEMKLVDLKLIYEFYNEWKQNKRNNYLIGAGSLHTDVLSQTLQNQFQFKKILEKTTVNAEQLKAIEQDSRPINGTDVEQMYIDLDKFFDSILNPTQLHSKL